MIFGIYVKLNYFVNCDLFLMVHGSEIDSENSKDMIVQDEYLPSRAGGTRPPPAMPHQLQNVKCQLEVPKLPTNT